jgi:hypothetical protein
MGRVLVVFGFAFFVHSRTVDVEFNEFPFGTSMLVILTIFNFI